MHHEAYPPPRGDAAPAPAPAPTPAYAPAPRPGTAAAPAAAPPPAAPAPAAPLAPPADWRYAPARTPSWWHRHGRTLRALGLVAALLLYGLTILALVREQTGTQGPLAGLVLAVLPVPLLTAAFRWLDGVSRPPGGIPASPSPGAPSPPP